MSEHDVSQDATEEAMEHEKHLLARNAGEGDDALKVGADDDSPHSDGCA
jgi:hypothetical protein